MKKECYQHSFFMTCLLRELLFHNLNYVIHNRDYVENNVYCSHVGSLCKQDIGDYANT